MRDTNAQLERMVEQLHSEGRLRNSIIENSPSAMIFFDNNYRITLANSAARHIAGEEELTGKNIKSMGIFGEILEQIKYDVFSEQGDSMERPIIVEIGQDEKKQSYRCNFYRSNDYSSIDGIMKTVENVTAEELKSRNDLRQKRIKLLTGLWRALHTR